jgi:hypothetical protein
MTHAGRAPSSYPIPCGQKGALTPKLTAHHRPSSPPAPHLTSSGAHMLISCLPPPRLGSSRRPAHSTFVLTASRILEMAQSQCADWMSVRERLITACLKHGAPCMLSKMSRGAVGLGVVGNSIQPAVFQGGILPWKLCGLSE